MKQISLRVSDSIFNYLEYEAKKKGTNPTEIVRQTIIKIIEQENSNDEVKQMLDAYLSKINEYMNVISVNSNTIVKNDQLIYEAIKTLKGVQK